MILPEIPRIYTALAEWMACLVYISTRKRRLDGWRLGVILTAGLVWQCFYLSVTGEVQTALWLPCMLLAAGFMYLLLLLCCDAYRIDIAYYCIQAVILAESAAALEWQLHCFLWQDQPPSLLAGLGLLAAVYITLFLFAVFVLRRNALPGNWEAFRPGELGVAAVIGAATFTASNLGFLSTRTPFSGSYSADVYIIRTVFDFCGMAALQAHYLQCRETRVRRELESVRSAMKAQYQQYQLSRETIDLIARKYHDMKHHIAVLRREQSSEQRNTYLDQMEEDILAYEALTGMPVPP